MEEQKGQQLVGGLYTQGKLLGMGQFPVYLATDQAGNTVAVKRVSSHIFDQDHEDLVKAEVSIMEHLDHPHLMKILAFHKVSPYTNMHLVYNKSKAQIASLVVLAHGLEVAMHLPVLEVGTKTACRRRLVQRPSCLAVKKLLT